MSTIQINMTKDGKINMVALWHPIDGKWRHITQHLDGPNATYYVDGEEVPASTSGVLVNREGNP